MMKRRKKKRQKKREKMSLKRKREGRSGNTRARDQWPKRSPRCPNLQLSPMIKNWKCLNGSPNTHSSTTEAWWSITRVQHSEIVSGSRRLWSLVS